MSEYKDTHRGETCLIIGNGPSLNQIPLDLLNKYPSFGTNRIYLMPDFTPTYYAAINALVVEQSFLRIMALDCPKFIRAQYADTLNAFPLVSLPGHGFSKDITQGVHEGWTVTYVCMQIAYYMGFSTALLVGCDHRYKQDGKPNQAVVATSADPNHFSGDYFGPGVKWQCADLAQSGKAYEIARDVYRADKRRIINLTPDTALEVFSKDDWRRWL